MAGQTIIKLDAKQRYLESGTPLRSNELTIINLALYSIRKRPDLNRLIRNAEEAREAIETEFSGLKPPRTWAKKRVLWLKEVATNTLLAKASG